MISVFCLNCGKYFDSGVPKYKKSDEREKKTVAFCSDECMKMYG